MPFGPGGHVPPPAPPWDYIGKGQKKPPQPQRQLLEVEEAAAAEGLPRHCSATTGKCAAPGESTQKQRNTITQFAAALGRPPPADLARLSYAEASEWLHRAFPVLAETGGVR